MTPERWQRVKEIFQRAAEIGSADRMTFVRRECADDESLLKEVEELLACHDVADAPIEKAAERGIVELRREMAAATASCYGILASQLAATARAHPRRHARSRSVGVA